MRPSSSSSSSSSPLSPQSQPSSSQSSSFLEQSSAMIARQRSQALYQCVSDGDISLDTILAFPLDWQGLEVEHAWRRSSGREESPSLPKTSPLATKTKRRPKSHLDSLPAFSAPTPEPLERSSLLFPELRFDVAPLLAQDEESDYIPSPKMSSSSSDTQPSSPESDFSIATPISSPTYDEDFTSYCNFTKDVDMDMADQSVEDWFHIGGPQVVAA